MPFLAIRADRQPAPEIWRNYVHWMDVGCRKCGEVFYQLWAPLEEQDDSKVQGQGEVLGQSLADDCPNHPDWFHLPAE